MNESIGKRIKELRLEQNMTQEELAIKAGYTSRSSINKIELGIVDIPQSKIILLSKALNVTPSYLIGFSDDATSKSIKFIDDLKDINNITLDVIKERAALLKEINNLNADDYEFIKSIIIPILENIKKKGGILYEGI